VKTLSGNVVGKSFTYLMILVGTVPATGNSAPF